MAKLDRLGWAVAVSGSAFGVRLGVRVSDRAALDDVVARLPPGLEQSPLRRVDRLYSWIVGGQGARPGLRRMHLVYADARLLLRTAAREDALHALESDARLHLAEHARRRVFIHAGVVAWHGRAILVPGRSHAGKSRLVEALVGAGATYYSDEYAVLDGRGRVHAFPCAVSVRASDGRPPRRIEAATLARGGLLPPLPVGMIVACSYAAGCAPRWRRVSRGEGALVLLQHAVPARRRPAEVLASLAALVGSAVVVRGVRSEAEPAARHLLTTFATWTMPRAAHQVVSRGR
jgi:hypothetical protein